MKLRLLLMLALVTAAHAEDLTGAWNVAKMQADGHAVPADVTKTLQLAFTATGYQLIQNGVALEAGQIKLAPGKIEFTPENAPAQPGTYELKGDALSITKGATQLELTRVPPPEKK